MCCTWRESNRQTFEDVDSLDNQLLASFSGFLFDWSWAWGFTSSKSLSVFTSSLLSCNCLICFWNIFLVFLCSPMYLSLCFKISWSIQGSCFTITKLNFFLSLLHIGFWSIHLCSDYLLLFFFFLFFQKIRRIYINLKKKKKTTLCKEALLGGPQFNSLQPL